MTRVLLTGATGFVGRPLAVKLVEEGFDLVAAVRQQTNVLPEIVLQVVVGNLTSANNWSNALDTVSTVIHTAARVHIMNDTASDPLAEFRRSNVDGTINLAKQSAAAGVNRFIFLSSIKVNGEKTNIGKPFTAEDTPAPVDPYGISKAETELALWDLSVKTGMEVVILRPVLVYGPKVKANFRDMMRWLNWRVPLPFGAIHNKRSLIALDNIVDLIITCIAHPAAANEIFLASDGKDISTTELLQWVGKALGKPARLIPIPAGILNIVASLLGKRTIAQRLLGSLQVDIKKTRELLGWSPKKTMQEGIDDMVKSFLSSNKTKSSKG